MLIVVIHEVVQITDILFSISYFSLSSKVSTVVCVAFIYEENSISSFFFKPR